MAVKYQMLDELVGINSLAGEMMINYPYFDLSDASASQDSDAKVRWKSRAAKSEAAK